jgi:hypothetical protein
MVQSELLSLKEDISTIQPVAGSPARAAVRMPAFVGLAVFAVVGLGLGSGLGYIEVQKTAVPPASLALPRSGLTVLTAPPHCDVVIAQPGQRDFLIGRTSAAGDLSLEDLAPGEYSVTVADADAGAASAQAIVKQGEATVLGKPPDPRLLANTRAKAGN